MCGITGYWARRGDGLDKAAMTTRVLAMAEAIDHRGPDGAGGWADPAGGVALGHRRLSIIDLSTNGDQPMVSRSGRFALVYNGEIYNAAEIRTDLESQGGLSFRGHSDTEVLLEACALWGVAATLPKLIGMFAFALWDGEERRLTLARDRLGIKPLYWGEFDGTLLFGSQPKALFPHPNWQGTIDRDALAAMLRLSCVPSPRSIYKGLEQVTPGTFVMIGQDGTRHRKAFWSLEEVAAQGIAARATPLSDAEATDRLEALLTDAVERRLISDVPLGAFLSGGVDSSTVVALMGKLAKGAVKTFSIGFDEPGWDESTHAQAVATHLGTDHQALTVSWADARALIPDLPHWYDEPFADASQIPTVLVSRLARGEVTVSLSGDGGDELFAGYNRHFLGQRLWSLSSRIPDPLRRLAAAGLSAPPPALWDALAQMLPPGKRPPQPADKAAKVARLLRAQTPEALYRDLVGALPASEVPMSGASSKAEERWYSARAESVNGFVDRMRLLDALGYLPDDILTKVDRASMAVGLEARVPILDHRVVEFAWSLPEHQLMREGQGKWLLRQVLYRHVPKPLIERPKMGFGVPVGAWLRGSLKDWAEDLLDPTEMTTQGLIDPAPLRAWWADHLSGRRDLSDRLWPVLMALSWHRHWQEKGVFRGI
ncbi:asparagine synthase (glutamine-hydrolyzing) [Rhodospirillum sp. A1_3_36]|uniref:asparagine synthase (glutamine-hydrolyzing) n=1 Tax=Rhodospirillum sp. A1_3_36 TaxID=3391666 RepID=UPI0039A6AEB1